jgi:hypothetical protein
MRNAQVGPFRVFESNVCEELKRVESTQDLGQQATSLKFDVRMGPIRAFRV